MTDQSHWREAEQEGREREAKRAVIKWTLATRDKGTWPPDRARILYVVMKIGHGDRFGSAWTRREGTGRDEYIAFVGGSHGAWGGVGEDWQLLWAPFPVPDGVVDDLATSRKSKYVV